MLYSVLQVLFYSEVRIILLYCTQVDYILYIVLNIIVLLYIVWCTLYIGIRHTGTMIMIFAIFYSERSLPYPGKGSPGRTQHQQLPLDCHTGCCCFCCSQITIQPHRAWLVTQVSGYRCEINFLLGCSASILTPGALQLGVIHKLRNHFWGSR